MNGSLNLLCATWHCLLRFFGVVCLACLANAQAAHAQESAPVGSREDALQLTLPPEFYAVPGVEMSLYFDNVVLTKKPEDLRFDVGSQVGRMEERRWTVTPSADQVGEHRLRLQVKDKAGRPLAKGSVLLRVLPIDAGAGETVRFLIVGDSLTHATLYPNAIASLISRPMNPEWKMLGTHRPARATEGVRHEGYGGWTWSRFTSYYNADPPKDGRKHQSPFIYLTDSEPKLDVGRYLREQGGKPDFAIFLLGINDCFSAPLDDLAGMDARINAMFKNAEILLAAFRAASPQTELGVCLTTPPNARESAFQANYQGRYTRWGWKRIQHRLVQRQLKQFGSRETESIFVVPTQLNIDPIDGYPQGNGVHPNAAGYNQIGASIYAWMKWRLAVK